MILQELEKSVKGALAKLGLEAEAVSFEHPENLEHGDYSSNIALVLGKKGGRSVQELAEAIASRIEGSKLVSRVEVAGPGFLNFFLDTGYLSKELSNIGKEKEKYGTGKAGRKKVMVEFTDPNPFKEFHIGHLYSNAVGESLSRLLEAEGADVRRVNYQGDVGLHVAKAVWGMRAGLEESGLSLKDLEKEGLSERVRFLGRSYAMGDAAYETGAAKEDIEELNVKIFARDESVSELYENGKKWSLEYFENIYGRLGTAFDHYYFESEVGKTGERIVKEGLKKGIFEESEGAVIFPGEKYGLHSRVFVNSRGLPTYEAKELGLAPTKYKDFSYDLSLIVTGNEIIGYFKVLLAALKETNPELAEKTRHLSHGMVRLPEGKMSSRTGNIVTAEQLIEEVKARVQSIMESSGSEIPKEEREEAAEHIAVGAIKYSLLRVSLGKDIAFDFDKSLSLEGESGPYLQYTYARCRSILRQAGKPSLKAVPVVLSLEEERILRLVYRFPEVVEKAAESFSPNMVAAFAVDLAQAYNLFYSKHRVLQAENKEARNFRLQLTEGTAQILQNSLRLLGIRTLEKM